MSYIRFSDLKFDNNKHKMICEDILLNIRKMQQKLVYDEEQEEYVSINIGPNSNVSKVFQHINDSNRKMLVGLKLAFFFYTGKNPDKVILESELNRVDIFSPLG